MFHCLLCHNYCSPLKDLCQPCYRNLPWNQQCCSRCSEPRSPKVSLDEDGICQRCYQFEPYFDQCIAPFRYEFPLDQLLLRGKSGNSPEHLRPLTRWLAEQLKHSAFRRPDLLVPVPLHPSKQRHRGYNQAGVIAHQLGRKLSIPVSHQLIHKTKELAQQKSLSKSEREQNLRRSFRIDQHALTHLKKPAHHIALIDDIVTTGSTVNQLAKQLSTCGIEHIDVWAIARTPLKQ